MFCNKTIKQFFLLLLVMFGLSSYGKTAVFIIGTGRCGSSCTAGVLQAMGLDLGNSFRDADKNNTKGTFEHLKTVEITRILLSQLSASFRSPRYIDWSECQKRNEFKNIIKTYLIESFGDKDVFGIKNPIISLFLPLYAEAANELGYDVKLIVVCRDYKETICSWMNAFSSSHRKAEKAVRVYLKALNTYAHQYQTLYVNFDDVVYELKKTAQKFKAFIPSLSSYEDVKELLHSFIDPTLKHHNQ